jgi:hypothetical protein
MYGREAVWCRIFSDLVALFLISGIFLWILFTILYEMVRFRKDMLPERYPFQHLYELLSNYDRINDYFLDLVEKFPQRRCFSMKIFVNRVLFCEGAHISLGIELVDSYK